MNLDYLYYKFINNMTEMINNSQLPPTMVACGLKNISVEVEEQVRKNVEAAMREELEAKEGEIQNENVE